MDWVEFLHQAAHHVLPAVPWLVGGACVAMVSLGPVGRALSHRLREGNMSVRRSAALMDEVIELRAEVGDVIERLDEHQRVLSEREDMRGAPRLRQWPSQEERVETPV
ncbi:hypothetical protein ACFL3B_01745 [Gemmatimonadota bacterium]